MRYTKYLIIVIVLNSCNASYKKDFKVDVMTREMKDAFLNIQDEYFINGDSSGHGNLYIYKSFDEEQNISISHRIYQTWCQKNVNNKFEIGFNSGSPSHPFLGTRIILMIEKNYTYQIEMECNTDVDDEVIKFDSIKRRCKYGVLHLSDTISDKLDNLSGFINIEVYKDTKFKKIDFITCLSFSIPNPSR